jgi:hypothetical protein
MAYTHTHAAGPAAASIDVVAWLRDDRIPAPLTVGLDAP